jgi:hypothetical protein
MTRQHIMNIATKVTWIDDVHQEIGTVEPLIEHVRHTMQLMLYDRVDPLRHEPEVYTIRAGRNPQFFDYCLAPGSFRQDAAELFGIRLCCECHAILRNHTDSVPHVMHRLEPRPRPATRR